MYTINRAEILPIHRDDRGCGVTYGALGVFINEKLVRQFPINHGGEYSADYHETKLEAEAFLAAEYRRSGSCLR